MKKLLVLFCILCSFMRVLAQNEPIYLFDEFEEGVVYLKNLQKSHVQLNYDASNLKMTFVNDGELLQINDNSLVDSVVVGAQLFLPYNDHFVERIRIGQGVLLVDWKLADKYTGRKIGAMGIGNAGSIEKINTGLLYARAITDDKTQEIYKRVNENAYYLNYKGKSVKFKNEKQLLKNYPAHKAAIKEFIRKNNINFASCEDVISLSRFIVRLDASF